MAPNSRLDAGFGAGGASDDVGRGYARGAALPLPGGEGARPQNVSASVAMLSVDGLQGERLMDTSLIRNRPPPPKAAIRP